MRCLLTEEFAYLFDRDQSKESGCPYDCDRSKESARLYDCGRFPHHPPRGDGRSENGASREMNVLTGVCSCGGVAGR
jgi:hypothetical protein